MPTLAQKIDRLGELENQLAPWKSKIKELKDLREDVRAVYEALDPKPADGVVTGVDFFCVLGPRRSEGKIKNMRAVFKAIGQRLFLAHCEFTLTSLKKVAPDQYDKLVIVEPTGSRDLKAHAIIATQKAA